MLTKCPPGQTCLSLAKVKRCNLINLIVTCLNNATSFSEGKIFFAGILKLNFILDGSKGMYG